MDLLDIIISTLKIFSLSAVTLVAFSYFFYKLKGSKRTKPFEKLNDPIIQAPAIQITQELNQNDGLRVMQEALSNQANRNDNHRDEIVLEKIKVVNNIPPKSFNNFRGEVRRNRFNIYDHYASNFLEPMHKVRS